MCIAFELGLIPTVPLFLLHKLLEFVLVLVPPTTQRRSSQDRIVSIPLHAPLVRVLRDIVIRAQDPELALGHLLL